MYLVENCPFQMFFCFKFCFLWGLKFYYYYGPYDNFRLPHGDFKTTLAGSSMHQLQKRCILPYFKHNI